MMMMMMKFSDDTAVFSLLFLNVIELETEIGRSTRAAAGGRVRGRERY